MPDAGWNVMMCLIQEFGAVAELVRFKICVWSSMSVKKGKGHVYRLGIVKEYSSQS